MRRARRRRAPGRCYEQGDGSDAGEIVSDDGVGFRRVAGQQDHDVTCCIAVDDVPVHVDARRVSEVVESLGVKRLASGSVIERSPRYAAIVAHADQCDEEAAQGAPPNRVPSSWTTSPRRPQAPPPATCCRTATAAPRR